MATKISQNIKKYNRKLASDVATWYFNQQIDDNKSDKSAKSKQVQFTPETWALLLTEAISSFNQGLETIIEPENRRASVNSVNIYNSAIDLVGEEAFRTIAFLVAAQNMRRPVDVYAKASTLFMQSQTGDVNAMINGATEIFKMIDGAGDQSAAVAELGNELVMAAHNSITQATQNSKDSGLIRNSATQLQTLAKIPGLSPDLAKQMASEGGNLINKADQFAASGTQTQGTLPTGVQIQGRKR